jgi:hypothetical protein
MRRNPQVKDVVDRLYERAPSRHRQQVRRTRTPPP